MVDDAAQALGARSAEGPAGAHGEVGVLISAAQSRCPRWAAARSPGPRIRRLRSIPPRSRRTHSALPCARSRTTPRWPPLLGVLARIPALGIGETVYDPGFAQDAILGPALSLARALLPEIASSTGRASVAPSAEAREATLATLRPPGASPFYPSSLARIGPLRPHVVGNSDCPSAESLANRIFTLPTQAVVRAQISAIAQRLRECTHR